MFTSWAVVLSFFDFEDEVLEKKAELIRTRYVKYLKSGSEFYDAITSSTGAKKNVQITLETVKNIIEDCIW